MSFSCLTAWRCRLLTQINYNRPSRKSKRTGPKSAAETAQQPKCLLVPTAGFMYQNSVENMEERTRKLLKNEVVQVQAPHNVAA